MATPTRSHQLYMQRKKRTSKEEKLLKVFLQLAPAGYDAFSGYKDWQYAKIGDPSYNGIKGMYKFMANPTTAGISIANGISRVQKYQTNNPGVSFSQAFKDLKANPETPAAATKTNSVTKPTSIQMDDVYDLLTPSEKREHDSLSSNLDNPEASKALHLLLSNKRDILESQGLKVNDADDTNYIPKRKDLVDQTTLMGYNKDTNQNNLELDADGNPTGNTFEYSNETKNFSILTDPDGNPIDEVTTNLNDTTENQANIKALLGNENRDIVDTNLDNKSLAVPNKSFDVDKVEHFNPLKLSYEKYKKQLDNPDNFTPDDYHEMMFGRKPLKTTSDMTGAEIESLIFNSGLSDNDKLHKLVQYKTVMANKDKISNSKQIDVKTDNSIDINESDEKPAGFLKRLLGLDKENKTDAIEKDIIPNTPIDETVKLKDIFSSNITKGVNTVGDIGNISNLSNLFNDNDDSEFSKSLDVAKAGNSAVNLGKGGAKLVKDLVQTEAQKEAAKIAAKEAAKIAAKEAAKEAAKKVAVEGGKELAKEGTKAAASAVPVLDIAANLETFTNKKSNAVNKLGALIDLTGTGAGATVVGAPLAVPLKIGGKIINYAGNALGPSASVREDMLKDEFINSNKEKLEKQRISSSKQNRDYQKTLADYFMKKKKRLPGGLV